MIGVTTANPGTTDALSDSGSVDERRMEVAGCVNLRDMGGVATADGRRVRRGLLFRSGVLDPPAEAIDRLAALGIRAIVDFRTSGERVHRPSRWHATLDIPYFAHDVELSLADLRRLAGTGATGPETAEALLAVYRVLPDEQAPAYRRLFALLADGETPLLFHCSGGKDRSGVAAALVLTVLGVPRATIAVEHVASNHAIPALRRLLLADPSLSAFAQFHEDALAALLESTAAQLDALWDELDRREGGVDGYLERVLGVTPRIVARLRTMLVE